MRCLADNSCFMIVRISNLICDAKSASVKVALCESVFLGWDYDGSGWLFWLQLFPRLTFLDRGTRVLFHTRLPLDHSNMVYRRRAADSYRMVVNVSWSCELFWWSSGLWSRSDKGVLAIMAVPIHCHWCYLLRLVNFHVLHACRNPIICVSNLAFIASKDMLTGY